MQGPHPIGNVVHLMEQNVDVDILDDNHDTRVSITSEIKMEIDQRKKRRLSRPERKALQRKAKARQYARNPQHKHQIQEALSVNSSVEDVIRVIKQAQKFQSVSTLRMVGRFLLDTARSSSSLLHSRGSLLSRFTVAALGLHQSSLVQKSMYERRQYLSQVSPMESAAIIRGFLRTDNATEATNVLEEELSLGAPDNSRNWTETGNQELLRHRVLSIASIASHFFSKGDAQRAVQMCQKLSFMGPRIRQSLCADMLLDCPWHRVLSNAAQCESRRRNGQLLGPNDNNSLPCNLVYAVLNAMTAFPTMPLDDNIYEIVSNALVRRVVFITGAVSMSGCPPMDRGEAAFIGRSNVGKSSLVNMITNRKSIAFTSKRPGKTQQYNFFAVNDKVDLEREIKYGDVIGGKQDRDSFYIVDLPGFGFAKVPDALRKAWSEFLLQYMMERKTLRVLFHLVDARHGPTVEDTTIMKTVGERLPSSVTYVVVLTKADKIAKGKSGRVPKSIMEAIRSAMNEVGVGSAPVLITSAETKLGRDAMWRYLRLAAESSRWTSRQVVR